MSGLEGLVILLRRLSVGAYFTDIGHIIGLQRNLVGSAYNELVQYIFNSTEKLRSLKHNWINAQNCELWSRAITDKGFPIRGICGFIDGKCLMTCHPKRHENEVYCGHHKACVTKFLIISFPNGLIIPIGPFSGSCADGGCMTTFGVEGILHEALTFGGESYCLLADKAFATTDKVIAPHKGSNLSRKERKFNRKHSQERVCVEYSIGTITNSFRRFQFAESLKQLDQPVGQEFIIAVHLTNIKTIIRGHNRVLSRYDSLSPPSLEEYMSSFV